MKPLYATIAHSGSYFSVTYRAERNADGTGQSSSVSGYSASLFDKPEYAGIPLIDYRTMDFTDINGATPELIAECCREVPLRMAEYRSSIEKK